MKYLNTLSTLFVIGSVVGYMIEVIFKRVVSKKKWINPGFMKGPYLPIYGFGLIILYQISSINFSIFNVSEVSKILIIILTFGVTLTLLELLTGFIFLKGFNIRLWDYSKEKLNLNGIICVKFSVYWTIIGVTYYFLLHPVFIVITSVFQSSFILTSLISVILLFIIIDALASFKVEKKLSIISNLINREVINIISYYKVN